MSLEDARQKMEAWRRYYNEERPHGAIGQKTPDYIAFVAWHTQPAIVTKPGNSNPRAIQRREAEQCRTGSPCSWMKLGAQVNGAR
jgi:hypothetical protein